MNNGASETWLILVLMRSQSSSLIRPLRRCANGTEASADKSRIVISSWLISNEKNADVSPCLTDADRARSKAMVDLPTPGLAAKITT